MPVPAKAGPVKTSPPRFKFSLKNDDDGQETQITKLTFPHFEDVAEVRGLNHVYSNGTSDQQLMVESTGGGGGWIDLDRDGMLDIYLPQGDQPDAVIPTDRRPDSFFRQSVQGTFENVASAAGVVVHEYGQGVSVADFNSDGFADLLVTNVGPNRLFTNCGDGTFRELSHGEFQSDNVWSSSAAWGDIDLDGDIDLYVCNYAQYDPYSPLNCQSKEGVRTICHPRNAEPEPDHFYLNHGDGSFSRSESALKLVGDDNRGLGVVISDLDKDGWPDVYVANDTTANFLYLNKSGKVFEESALGYGGAVNAVGKSQASMGIGVGDYDENGYLDLCLTHFSGEYNTLYQNLGASGFRDATPITGLRNPTLSKLAFGVVMQDFNSDGHLDVIFANGHIDPLNPDGEGYKMTSQLLSFDGSRWRDGSKEAGDFFKQKIVGRGLAVGDMDNDGDSDVLLVPQNSQCHLLENNSTSGHWLRIKLIGRSCNRDAVGAKVVVKAGDRSLYNELLAGSGFASAHELVLAFGLGDWSGPVTCTVTWPTTAQEQVITLSGANTSVTMIEGRPGPLFNPNQAQIVQ